MPDVMISYTAGGADRFTAQIDGKQISFAGTAKAGSVTLPLPSGTYKFTYLIEGQPGSKYEIKIEGSKPDKTIKDTIAASGRAVGGLRFIVASTAAIAAAVVTTAAVAIGAAVATRRIRSARKKKKEAAGDEGSNTTFTKGDRR
jgi:hypothetical protein